MAVLKFDDLQKSVADIFDEDYQTSGYQLKAKQKTSWAGAVATTTVDLFGKDSVKTPAKISWKFPNPFGVAGVSVDKLELSKDGKFKFEVSADKALHKVSGLKFEAKSDLERLEKVSAALTYTGLKDTQLKIETKPLNVTDFTLEVTRAFDKITVGLKGGLSNIQAPDLGVRAEYKSAVLAVLLKDKFAKQSAYLSLAANSDLKVAAWGTNVSSKAPQYGFGVAYNVIKGTSIKAKVDQALQVSGSVKRSLAAGVTAVVGGQYNTKTQGLTYGLQLSIE